MSTSKELERLLEAGKTEQQQEFIGLRAKGWSYRKIAKRLKVSATTLTNWARLFEQEIASLKALELEALQESYYMAKEARIRMLGDQLKSIRAELGKRDLSEVPTDRLLELLLKVWAELKEEYVEPRPLTEAEQEALRNNTGAKLDAGQVAERLQGLLERYRAGQVSEDTARQEMAILLSLLKAYESSDLESKLDRIEAALEGRKPATVAGNVRR